MLHAIDFRELKEHAKEGDDLHWQKLLETREKLQEYSITLLKDRDQMDTFS